MLAFQCKGCTFFDELVTYLGVATGSVTGSAEAVSLIG